MTKKLLFLLAILASFSLMVACGDEETTVDGDIEGAEDCPSFIPGSKTFTGYVEDFQSKTNAPGITVYLVCNETGLPIAGIDPQVSDANGELEFPNMPDDDTALVGFLSEKQEGVRVNTYQFNIRANGQNERLWSVDYAMYQAAPAMAGLTLDTTKGVVAGAVYWVNEAKVDEAAGENGEEPVGCATVATDPASGEARYFNDARLPTTTDKRENVNPLNGFFLFGNIDPGATTLRAYVGNTEIGSTDMISVGDESIAIANIYAETDSNPKTCD